MRRTPQGYGRVRFFARDDLAHRIAFRVAKGEPGALSVLHRCDNPPCCNPDHLFLGTAKDNAADMVAKGRAYCGRRHWNATVQEDDVRDIRRRAEAGERTAALASEYGLTHAGIRFIVTRKKWRHVA
jgi:hypothetical protein